MTTGKRIAKLRKSKGLSQNELASRLRISKSSLAMYETDKREPSFEITNKLVDFFNVTSDYLLGRTDKKSIEEDKIDDPEYHLSYKEWSDSPEENRKRALDFLRFLNEHKEREEKDKRKK